MATMASPCPRRSQAQSAVLLALLVLVAVATAFAVPADTMASSPAAPSTTPPSQRSTSEVTSQNVSDFFPQIDGDLTKVTWAHAVNSVALLEATLKDDKVMMLEADVVMGKKVNSTSTEVEPIMGHPPSTESDLSLQDFLREIIKYNNDHKDKRRGVKLDFKSIEVFEKSMDFLKQTFKSTPDFPVWLNADILAGPVKATAEPVDPTRFLTKAKAEYPELTLSLGWTTRWGKGLNGEKVSQDEAKYVKQSVDDMIKAIKDNGVVQPITYALRAAFVANSLPEIESLLKDTPSSVAKPTITVWSSDDTDEIEVKKLRENILKLGKTSVYVDVGSALAKELNLASSAVSVCASVATTALALLALLASSL